MSSQTTGRPPTGPNSGNCHGGVIPSLPTATCTATNQYDLQLIKAGLQFFPAPSLLNLFLLTQQVAQNNNFYRTQSAADAATTAAVVADAVTPTPS